MIPRKALFALTLSALALAACAPQRPVASAPAPAAKPVWAFDASDVKPEDGWRFGRLANGMRYAIRANALPKGTAMVRMQVGAGSLDESEAERGFAHYVEHMAFNGSTHVPEGEMVKLLEREGLAFGADTNAVTNYERTVYMLDLPRSDDKLIDTALMLMRETASELTFDPAAVERERGVVKSELRDRNGFALRNYQDQVAFLAPKARYGQRLPIGTVASLDAATAERLKAFWAREYVPAQTTVVMVGDFDPDKVEAQIRTRFESWKAAPAEPQPDAGPVDPKLAAKADVFIDPALSERVSASRIGTWLDEPDNLAQRRENLLRQIGYAVINRRLLSLTRQENAPFRSAGLGSSDIFEAGRMTSLAVDTVDGKWRRGLITAAQEYRRALAFGFTKAEIAEQVANIRTANRNAAASASTRANAQLMGAVMALIEDEVVPDSPANSLARLEAFIPEITPESVLAALKREMVPLDKPLLRFQGRVPPAGGDKALAKAWAEAMRAAITPPDTKAQASFGYTDFGPAGQVVADSAEPLLGIRTLRFANGVRLNLKHTELEADKVRVLISLDGGNLLMTRDNPKAVAMSSVLTLGGLGKHSKDELDTLLAGRSVSSAFGSAADAFTLGAVTTPADLELQLQLNAAQITDPGYRKEGEVLFRQTINNMFAALRATPGSAFNADYGAITSDNDPRFSLGTVEQWRALTFDKLKADITDRLKNGAIEVALVGAFDDAKAIEAVARTFGALPAREADFRPYAENRSRTFTADRKARVLHHSGPKDQAMVTLTWPTRDGEDPVAEIELDLLEAVVRDQMIEVLREKLGKAYGPGASSNASRVWKGYGTFMVNASVEAAQVSAARAAILEAIAQLRDAPISADAMQRARAPIAEQFDNALKTNGGWMAFAARAQSLPDRIERLTKGKARLMAITPEQLQALARKYLAAKAALEVTVLPDGMEGG